MKPVYALNCSRICLFLLAILGLLLVGLTHAAPRALSPLTFYDEQIEPAANYLRQADLNPSPMRQDLLLKATVSYLQNNDVEGAQATIERLYTDSLTVKQLSQAKLLNSQIALRQDQPQKALDVLYTLPPYMPYHMMVMQHDLLAQAYDDIGEYMLSIEQRLTLNTRLKEEHKQQYNNKMIWQTCLSIPPEQVLAIHNATSNPILKAWLSVANMQNQYQQDPAALEDAMQQWRKTYPEHPGLDTAKLQAIADTNIAASTAPAAASMQPQQQLADTRPTSSGLIPIPQSKPLTIAVLLPEHGEYAQAAKAIKQGIMNAYYNDPEESRPIVKFFDSSHNARAAYYRATEQGADLVIGPLSKENVIDVYRGKHFPVPTLALNDLPYQLARKAQHQFYQFSLSNEDEAFQAAMRATQDNRVNALIIRSDKDWGQKLDEAFSSHFEHFGGSIRERLILRKNQDPTPMIKKLLQFDEKPKKEKNYNPMNTDAISDDDEMVDDDIVMGDNNELDSQSGETLPINPQKEKLVRHRTDVDLIFLALSPAEAQRVIPLFKFYYATDIPIYTTSVINSAPVDENQDLDGAIFCDMPWILSNSNNASELRQVINQQWPHSYSTQPRLFAFGVDAYQVARQLQKQNSPLYQGMQGYTGKLMLVSDNKINRQLSWAQFKNGKFQALDKVQTQ